MERDSAGIRIIDHVAPAHSGEWWSVAPEPTIVIGASDGDAPLLFFQVPHPGVTRLSDGTVVVIDGATNDLRYFDADGRHLRTTGGSGDGPGEFQAAGVLLELRQDSAVVLDHFAARISVFGPTGTFAYSISLADLAAFTPGAMFPFGFAPAVLPRMPAFGRMLTDPHQNLWVQEVRDDRDPRDWEFGAPRGSTRWRVLDPEDLWLGTLDLPDGFQLHSVGDDHLLGVWKDAAEVEFIHLYRLVRS